MEYKFSQDYYSGQASNYYGGYNLDGVREKYFSEKVAYIKQKLGGGGRLKILDIGCAFGYFLKKCDQEGWQTFGLDISAYAIERAAQETKAELRVFDITKERLPFPDNYFDAIVAFDIVEHLAEQKIFFAESRRTLKPAGIFLVESAYGRSRIDYDQTHVNIKNELELSQLLNSYGFKVLEIKKGRHYPKRIIPLRRYRTFNFLNRKICDLVGWYLMPLAITAQKK